MIRQTQKPVQDNKPSFVSYQDLHSRQYLDTPTETPQEWLIINLQPIAYAAYDMLIRSDRTYYWYYWSIIIVSRQSNPRHPWTCLNQILPMIFLWIRSPHHRLLIIFRPEAKSPNVITNMAMKYSKIKFYKLSAIQFYLLHVEFYDFQRNPPWLVDITMQIHWYKHIENSIIVQFIA